MDICHLDHESHLSQLKNTLHLTYHGDIPYRKATQEDDSLTVIHHANFVERLLTMILEKPQPGCKRACHVKHEKLPKVKAIDVNKQKHAA